MGGLIGVFILFFDGTLREQAHYMCPLRKLFKTFLLIIHNWGNFDPTHEYFRKQFNLCDAKGGI